ncbi:MAG: glycosyltransferase family 2 protein [Anaerolineales bacterium]|nr:glycosyltransferase family 2 protein [Anaerolineales bacterium]
MRPFLSIIIPAYNEETRLPATLEQIFTFLQSQPYTCEVLVVENGSRDRTLHVAQAFAQTQPALKVIHNPERGKGLAVRRGMLEARGEYRFMCDADLSMPPSEINRFLPPLLKDAAIAIASREVAGAVRYNEPTYRHWVGRGYNLLIRWLALPNLHDTQCGFKCFRGDIAEKLFAKQTLTGWSFDVEILFISRRLGYEIVEIPIPWYYNAESKINVFRDSLRMGMDLLKIRINDWRGVYRIE